MTLINKGFKFAVKIPQRELTNTKKLNNKKLQSHVEIYNKIHPELFTEIIKILKLKTMIKSKKY